MRITGVTTTRFDSRLLRRIGSAKCPAGVTHRSGWLLEVATDIGLVGIAVADHDIQREVAMLTQTLLIGEDPRGVTGLWQRMNDARFDGAHSGVAQAALDIALWDLKAKANDEPLWKTLGGAAPRVNVHASGYDSPLSDDELFAWYHTMATQFGIRSGLLKVGLDQDADLRRVKLMREALLTATTTPTLMIDADECWSPKEAIRRVREMERQFDLAWVEAPTARRDFPGLKRISDSVHAAISAGEHIDTISDFLPHLQHRALDVIQINSSRVGITGALQLADAAFGFELPVVLCHSPGNINAHLAGAMPYAMSLEVVHATASGDPFTTGVNIENGWAITDERIGHGLMIDREALAAATLTGKGA